jgi:hypothetical protein
VGAGCGGCREDTKGDENSLVHLLARQRLNDTARMAEFCIPLWPNASLRSLKCVPIPCIVNGCGISYLPAADAPAGLSDWPPTPAGIARVKEIRFFELVGSD